MPIPLYGFLEGDTLGLLVLAEETESILQLAQKLQESASLRVPRKEAIRLLHDGHVIDPTLTVKQSGLQALDRFDVVWSSGQ